MPQYFAPGVYVEEVPGTPPISGVGTSTAGFLGVVDTTNVTFQMPLLPGSDTTRYTVVAAGVPTLITSWDQFKTRFGDFQAANATLAHAVYGFFNNGGTRVWVNRIADIANTNNVRDGLQQFEAIDEIAIVAVPGALAAAAQTEITGHCENMQDRFAILDGQITTTITVGAIQGTVGDSDYAAMYFPRIQVYDPITDALIYVHTSGHMAGIYARVDAERGVHKAPANENVRGALGLEYLVSRNEQAGLNPDGINVIRGFDGNIKVWGARTLGGQANGEFRYINVRRLMNFLRESIDEGTQFAVFEPNSPPLWARIRRSVGSFLTNVWRDGALFGTTPEEAFYVRCDETTNPPEVREAGMVITEIGVAIVKPAEFVIFRIAQLTSSASS
ncbi:MAG: phage tail sheath family protein [Anaerolineae bacterium]|nr:phage tail sheath family protein [Anaerolineae bacterium]